MRRRCLPVVRLWLLLCAIPASGHSQSPAPRDSRSFSVRHYDVQIEPRLESRTITGSVALSVVFHRDGADTLVLNRGRLEIDSVHESGRARPFVVDGARLRITVPRGRRDETRT